MRELKYTIPLMVIMLGAPLFGVWLDGQPLAKFLEFPPRTQYVEHAGFLWPIFGGLLLFGMGVILPFVLTVCRNSSKVRRRRTSQRRLPWWGWLGVGLSAVMWFLGWNRFTWFAPLQPHTFTPLWLGFILVVNAWTWKRSGHCMLIDRPRLFLVLFPLSAAFWWFFEILNRFAQNWHYVGIGEWSAGEYFSLATLSFATVLPAVLGTCELLQSVPRLAAGLSETMPVRVRRPRRAAGLTLVLATCGLAGLGVWPDYLFPLLWISPLLVIVSLPVLLNRPHCLGDIARGDWRVVWLSALSGLLCGFFWEMWNAGSMAKWIYTVPWVGRFRLFEMPILGYLGYLPFGVECLVVADWLAGYSHNTPQANSAIL